MRILMLTQFYPPLIGGEELHVQALSRALVARGHQVAVVTMRTGATPAIEEDAGVRVYRIRGAVQQLSGLFSSPDRPFAPPLPDPALLRGIAAIMRQEQPEIVHAHNWLVHSFLPLKGHSAARLVVTLHNYHLVCVKTTLMEGSGDTVCAGPRLGKCLTCAAQHYGPLKGSATVLAQRMTSSAIHQRADCFIPVSNAVAVGSGLAGSAWPYEVIPNFLADDAIEASEHLPPELTAYTDQLPSQPYMLYVGAFSRIKGVGVLLRAYRRLVNPPPLVLIGYEIAADRDLLADVPAGTHILRDWPRAATMYAWRRSLFGVIPSICPDSSPTVTLEAMASSRAIIASRIGGLVDQVREDETGVLVPPGDEAALATAMETLLADQHATARMGEAGKKHARHFLASEVVQRIERLYMQVMSANDESERAHG